MKTMDGHMWTKRTPGVVRYLRHRLQPVNKAGDRGRDRGQGAGDRGQETGEQGRRATGWRGCRDRRDPIGGTSTEAPAFTRREHHLQPSAHRARGWAFSYAARRLAVLTCV